MPFPSFKSNHSARAYLTHAIVSTGRWWSFRSRRGFDSPKRSIGEARRGVCGGRGDNDRIKVWILYKLHLAPLAKVEGSVFKLVVSGAALAIWGEDVPLSGRWGWGHSPGFVRPPSPHRWQADLPTSASGLHETASAPESKDNRLS